MEFIICTISQAKGQEDKKMKIERLIDECKIEIELTSEELNKAYAEEKRKLVRVVKECVELGLEQVKPWGFLGDMSQAVYDHATENGYQVVRNIGGHGVGLEFHEDPWVGYIYKKGTQMVMAPGMMFTIEPMVNMGTHKISVDKKNGWTVYTNDKKPSAQWEIQVLVTEDGHEVISY